MKLIIADSNDIIRIGLRTILSSQKDIQIVAESRSANELMSQLSSFDVDIVVLDFTAVGFTVDIVQDIKKVNPKIGVVAITPDQNAATLVDAIKLGVKSYIKKDCDFTEIINSVTETFSGNRFFCGQVLETIQRASIDLKDIDEEGLSCSEVVLSEREIEIITLIAEGLTNVQIAEHLFLSPHTVTTHRKNIMSKLGVKNTAAIVMYAVKMNLVSPNKFLFAGEQK